MAAIVSQSDLPDGQTKWEFSCDLEVDYESEDNDSVVYAALAVDKEPDKVKRNMHLEAIETRLLRASFSAFVDVLTLATKTMEEFGQGIEL